MRRKIGKSILKQPIGKTPLVPDAVVVSVKDMTKTLSRTGIIYMIVGAIPVSYYGRPRLSRDADIAVLIRSERDNNVLHRLIGRARYYVISPDKLNRDLTKHNIIRLVDRKTGIIIVLLPNPSAVALTPQSFDRAWEARFFGKRISMVSPEDYILMKLNSRRGIDDFRDMFTTMTYNKDRLDWEYLGKRASELGVTHLLNFYKEKVGA